jgi:hypothetical protein
MAVDQSPEAIENRAAELQRTRDTTASIDSSDLFRNAMTDAPPPPKEEPAPQQPEPSPAPPPAQADAEQPRDEHGRFIPRASQPTDPTPQAPVAATQQQPGQPVPKPEEDTPIPSWRARELREQREAEATRVQQLAAELAEERRIRMHWQQQIAAQQQQPAEVPDLIADPAAYHAHVERTFNERLRNMEANFSFRIQHDRHGETFEQAYQEMLGRAERGDRTVVQSVMASPDPGAAMMNWYQREQTIRTVGADPNKWFEQQLLERLKDEKFKGSLLNHIRGAPAQPSGNGQAPPANYQVPPSLSRVPGAAASGQGGDMSDASLFAHAMRSGR